MAKQIRVKKDSPIKLQMIIIENLEHRISILYEEILVFDKIEKHEEIRHLKIKLHLESRKLDNLKNGLPINGIK